MIRIIRLPFRLVTLPVRIAAGAGRAGWYAGRAVGFSRSAFFGLGFATGVLVVSPKARQVALTGARRATVAVAKARQESPAPPPDVAEEGSVGPAPAPAASRPDPTPVVDAGAVPPTAMTEDDAGSGPPSE